VVVRAISFWEAAMLQARQRIALLNTRPIQYGQNSTGRPMPPAAAPLEPAVTASPATNAATTAAAIPLDLTDFKRDLSELTDRLGQAQDCL